ncbi:MAG: tetratricopeptide repeat protein [Acidobacteriota bacterium]|nr:tetratricopeptide repeat protein [Acidobacteriota bacterium]
MIKVGQPTSPAENFDDLFENAIKEGNAARDERDYAKAEVAYLRAQSLKTKDSRAIYGLGNLFSDQQRWEEAERAYRTAIQLEPNSPEAYVALSFVLTQPIAGANLGGRYAEAEQFARAAIKLDAGNALAFDQLGVSLELQGKISDETNKAYKKAIELDSTFALAYAHLGRLLRRKGLTNESSAAYRTAIELSTDVPTMILVADVMQSQQRYVESEQLLRRALRQDAKIRLRFICLDAL